MQRRQASAHVLVRGRIQKLEPAGDGLELRVGSRERRTRRQARNGAEKMGATEEVLPSCVRRPRRRLPDVDPLGGKREASWGDANDLVRLAIDPHGPADDTWIGGEPLTPKAIRDHDGVREAGRRPCLVRKQRAAELRAHAEKIEEVTGDIRGLENLRRAFAGERRVSPVHVQRDVAERAHLILPIERVGGRDQLLMPTLLGIFLPEHNEPLRLGEWKRLENHRVHRRENGRVRADAERESEDGSGREHRRASQRAQRITSIGGELLEPAAAHVAMRLLSYLDAAEVAQRAAARVAGIHSGAHVLLRFHVEVKAQFFVELALGGAAMHQGAQPRAETLDRAHETPGVS